MLPAYFIQMMSGKFTVWKTLVTGSLAHLIFFALLVRFGVLLFAAVTQPPTVLMTNDTRGYVANAATIAELGRMAVSLEHPDIPATLRTPGYPLFLASTLKLFGPSPYAVSAIQVLLSGIIVWLIYQLAGGATNEKVALLAIGFYAIDFTSITYSLLLLTETLFTFFLVIALLCAARFFQSSERLSWLGWAGCAFALATLVRPVSYYLLFAVFGLILVVSFVERWSNRHRLSAILLFVLPCVVLVGGWQLRQYRITGSESLSQIEGLNLLYYRGAGVVSRRDGVSLNEARTRLMGENIQPWTQASLNPEEGWGAIWKTQGIAIIRQHPMLFAQMTVSELARQIVGSGEGELLHFLGFPKLKDGPLGDIARLAPSVFIQKWIVGSPVYFVFFVVGMLLLFALYFGCAVWLLSRLSIRKLAAKDLLLWGTLFYLMVISAGPETGSRFRVPIVPILSIYAASGYMLLGSYLATQRRKSISSTTTELG